MKGKERERLIAGGRRMYEAGLVTGALGSIGMKASTGEFVVTADGSRLGFLEDADMLVLNGNGLPAGPKSKHPGLDTGILSAVLAAQPEAGSVIRVNSPYTTALSHRGRRRFEQSLKFMEGLGGVAFIPYYRPGTAGLAGAVADALRTDHVAIIERQGAVVRGRDLSDAIDRAEALEAAAKVVFLLASGNGVS